MSSARRQYAASVLPPPAAPVSVRASSGSETHNTGEGDSSAADTSVIDMDIFGQLLEMDDDEEHSFSKPLVEDYVSQAGATLAEMQAKLDDSSESKAQRLDFLSSKGHFLKGSSAALGVVKVRDSCEALQNLGKCKDEAGQKAIPESVAWDKCLELIPVLQKQHKQATESLSTLCGF